jgi:hypothetical protein
MRCQRLQGASDVRLRTARDAYAYTWRVQGDEVLHQYEDPIAGGYYISGVGTFVDGRVDDNVNWWLPFDLKHAFRAFSKRIFIGLSRSSIVFRIKGREDIVTGIRFGRELSHERSEYAGNVLFLLVFEIAIEICH